MGSVEQLSKDLEGADDQPPAEPGAPSVAKRVLAFERIIVAVALVLLLCGSVAFVAESGADAAHVESGVSVLGVQLGGRDEAGVTLALTELEQRLTSQPIHFKVGERTIDVQPSRLGFAIDREAMAKVILAAGRPTGFIDKLRHVFGRRVVVPLDVSVDDELVSEVMGEVERDGIDDVPVEGDVVLDGVTPRAIPPKVGRRIRREELSSMLLAELRRGASDPIVVPVDEVRPSLTQAEVEAALAIARDLAAGPIVLVRAPTLVELEDAMKAETLRQRQIDEARKLERRHGKKRRGEAPAPKPPPPSAQPKTVELAFTREEMASMIRTSVDPAGPHLVVKIDGADVERKLSTISQAFTDSARDARFEVDAKDRITIVPSRAGTRVDVTKVIPAIFDASTKAERRGELPVEHGAQPGLTTEDAEKLQIKGLVTTFTTRHPCCQPRVVNIHRIADMMDGVILRPGDTFSVNKFVGPRTSERGFVLAPSIGDGEMIDTVGGGISQFATTLFNALFNGGYAIRERKAHSYYFNRYPMGIEATLSDPTPDLVFVNDTEAGLLIKTIYDGTSITVRLYGDNGGRRVVRHVSSIFDVTEPKLELEANDALEPDEEKVVEHARAGGAAGPVARSNAPNGTSREEKRKITYNPRRRLVRVHSCNIPEGEPGHTGKPCPKPAEPSDAETTSSDASSAASGAFDPNAIDPTLPEPE